MALYICPQCGRPISKSNNFCASCGLPLKGFSKRELKEKNLKPQKTTQPCNTNWLQTSLMIDIAEAVHK